MLELAGALVDGQVKWLPSRAEPKPKAIICDHDAEDRETLHKHLQMETTPAFKDISPGIQAVATRLRPAGDGKPRLFILRDSVDERDPRMEDLKKPTSTAEEMEGYIWDERQGRKRGEEPLKENDHGCDALRYLTFWRDRFDQMDEGEPFVFPRPLGPGGPPSMFWEREAERRSAEGLPFAFRRKVL